MSGANVSGQLELWKRSGLGTGKVSSSTVMYSKETYLSSKAQPGCSMQPLFNIKLHKKRHVGENICGDATVYSRGGCCPWRASSQAGELSEGIYTHNLVSVLGCLALDSIFISASSFYRSVPEIAKIELPQLAVEPLTPTLPSPRQGSRWSYFRGIFTKFDKFPSFALNIFSLWIQSLLSILNLPILITSRFTKYSLDGCDCKCNILMNVFMNILFSWMLWNVSITDGSFLIASDFLSTLIIFCFANIFCIFKGYSFIDFSNSPPTLENSP